MYTLVLYASISFFFFFISLFCQCWSYNDSSNICFALWWIKHNHKLNKSPNYVQHCNYYIKKLHTCTIVYISCPIKKTSIDILTNDTLISLIIKIGPILKQVLEFIMINYPLKFMMHFSAKILLKSNSKTTFLAKQWYLLICFTYKEIFII